MADPTGSPKEIAQAIAEITERSQSIIREEIELAKAEVTEKVTKIAKGAAIGAAAGIFVLAALIMLLNGFAWLAYFVLPVGNDFSYFWGFFFMALVLLVLAAVAGLHAKRFIGQGSPPKPDMAIEEAQRVKETVKG